MDLVRERRDQIGETEGAQIQHAARRVPAAHPHDDRDVVDGRRRRAGVTKPAPPRLGGIGLLGPVGGVFGALLERLHQPEQSPLLIAPALDRIAKAALTLLAGAGICRICLAMHPRAVAFERQNRVDSSREDLAVVGDHQHGLLRSADLALQRELRRDIEEVVGLVEQQHIGIGAKQHVEDQLFSLAARKSHRRTVRQLVKPNADDPPTGSVPLALELVPAKHRPVRDRRAKLDAGIGVARCKLQFMSQHPLAGQPERQRRQRQQQLPHGSPLTGDADVLRHVADDPTDRGVALVSVQRSRKHPEQRALAHTVGPDKADMPTLRNPKRHVREQQLAARVGVSEPGNHDMPHQSPAIPESMAAMLVVKLLATVKDCCPTAPTDGGQPDGRQRVSSHRSDRR